MKTQTKVKKEKIGVDLKKLFAGSWLSDCADSHLEGWKDRYYLKSKKQLEEDLYVNHDPSLEIYQIEEELGRKLTSPEYDYAVGEFNETVISKLKS